MKNCTKLFRNIGKYIKLIEINIVKNVHPIGFNAEHQSTIQYIGNEGTLENANYENEKFIFMQNRQTTFEELDGAFDSKSC